MGQPGRGRFSRWAKREERARLTGWAGPTPRDQLRACGVARAVSVRRSVSRPGSRFRCGDTRGFLRLVGTRHGTSAGQPGGAGGARWAAQGALEREDLVASSCFEFDSLQLSCSEFRNLENRVSPTFGQSQTSIEIEKICFREKSRGSMEPKPTVSCKPKANKQS